MIRNIKKITALTLAACLLPLYGCGGAPENNAMPMGRYVEDVLELPGGANRMITQMVGMDGSLEIYTQNEGGISQYSTKDGEFWNEETVDWRLSESMSPLAMAYNSAGELFIAALELGQGAQIRMGGPQAQAKSDGPSALEQSDGPPAPERSDGEAEEQQGPATLFGSGGAAAAMHLYSVLGDGSLKDADVKWNSNTGMEFTMISEMKFLENGDMIVGQYGTGIVQYGPDGLYKRTYGDTQPEAFAVSGNKIYLCDSRNNSILVYDGETFDHESSLSFDNFSMQTGIAAGRDGAVYLYNSNGVFRLLPDGSIFEKIIDGDLTSLSMPNNNLSGFAETPGGEFLILGSDGMESKLFRYTYNPDIAARPEKELVVFSLYDNRTLRQAAGVFQKKHPDTRVNIQIGMGDDGATVSDITRTLNTEIMANKGPDIIMLDGLNADNYIEKGVLLDIKDLLNEESSRERMVENVLSAFERDGKIYAVPAKFSMPLIFLDAVNRDAARDISSLADFAAANPDKGVIGNKTAENLLKIFLPGSMPGWFDGNEIDEIKLAEFFSAVKTMADTPAPVLIPPERNMGSGGGRTNMMIGRIGPAYEIGESNPDDIQNFAFGDINSYISRISSFRSLMGANMAMEYRGDCVALPLPGLVESVYIPSAIAGINTKSGHIDIAEDFLRTMLSKDVQGVNLGDGFAVNVDAIESTFETENNVFMSIASQSRAGAVLSGGMPDMETQRMIMDLCLAVKTPYLVNDTLAEMVIDEAKGYFSGEKDLDKAIADIRERTKLYLAE